MRGRLIRKQQEEKKRARIRRLIKAKMGKAKADEEWARQWIRKHFFTKTPCPKSCPICYPTRHGVKKLQELKAILKEREGHDEIIGINHWNAKSKYPDDFWFESE